MKLARTLLVLAAFLALAAEVWPVDDDGFALPDTAVAR